MNYTILIGWKYCLPPFPIFSWNKNVFVWTDIVFDNSFIYDIGEDQKDIQKLCGVAWGSVHENSARFGCRYAGEGMVEILAYCYDKGLRLNTNEGEKIICRVELNQPIQKLELTVTASMYIFTAIVNGATYSQIQPKIFNSGKLAWYCRPHFEPKAPHKIKIKMK